MTAIFALGAALGGGAAPADPGPAPAACPPFPYGIAFALADPVLVPGAEPQPVRLAPGAVVASETMRVGPVARLTDSPIHVEQPSRTDYPAGTLVARQIVFGHQGMCMVSNLTMRPIGRPAAHVADARGRYPFACLDDGDGTGRYRAMIFFSLPPGGRQPFVRVPIAPVRLLPASDAILPTEAAFGEVGYASRRIVVAGIDGDRARFTAEQAWQPGLRPGRPHFHAGTRVTEVTLREGALDLAGAPVAARRDASGWSLTAAGRFQPWIALECDRRRIRIGAAATPAP
jgi:hypothetical protein